jgi:hypothetical protein
VPNAFTHSNVVAVLMPKTSLSLRISEYQVCWRSYSNRTYQVQYRSSSTSNAGRISVLCNLETGKPIA